MADFNVVHPCPVDFDGRVRMPKVDYGAGTTHGAEGSGGYNVDFFEGDFNAAAFDEAFHLLSGQNLGVAILDFLVNFFYGTRFLLGDGASPPVCAIGRDVVCVLMFFLILFWPVRLWLLT